MRKENKLTEFAVALLPAAVVLMLHLVFILGGIYKDLPWIDIILHSLGGGAVSWAGFVLVITFVKQLRLTPPPLFIISFFAISLTMTIGVFWEFGEFLWTYLFNILTQESLADTLSDLFFDFHGALLLMLLIFLKKSKI